MGKVSFTIAIIICLISHISKAQVISKKRTDVENDGFKGKIMQVEIAPYYSKKKSGQVGLIGNILKDERYHRIIKYDELGYKVEETQFCIDERFNEAINMKYTYIHDELGNAIVENHFNITGKLTETYTFKYDNKANLIEMNYFKPADKFRTRTNWKYDTSGRIIEIINYNSSFEVLDRSTFSFSETGKCYEAKLFNSKGKLICLCNYDENGNRIVSKKDKFSRRFFPYIIGYDGKSILANEKYYNSNKSPFKINSYDNNGILREISEFDSKNRIRYHIINDENGYFNSWSNSKGEKVGSSKNEYDSIGNITNQTIFYKSRPKFKMNWKYTYY